MGIAKDYNVLFVLYSVGLCCSNHLKFQQLCPLIPGVIFKYKSKKRSNINVLLVTNNTKVVSLLGLSCLQEHWITVCTYYYKKPVVSVYLFSAHNIVFVFSMFQSHSDTVSLFNQPFHFLSRH